jgi:hypothetical protein
MTEETELKERQSAVQEGTEREVIELTVELDPAHQRMDLALREAGADVEELVAQQITPSVEQTLHDVLQQVKYGE